MFAEVKRTTPRPCSLLFCGIMISRACFNGNVFSGVDIPKHRDARLTGLIILSKRSTRLDWNVFHFVSATITAHLSDSLGPLAGVLQNPV